MSRSEDPVVESTVKNTYGTWRFQKTWKPLHVVDAEGCYFYDASNRRYLDFSSQLVARTLATRTKP